MKKTVGTLSVPTYILIIFNFIRAFEKNLISVSFPNY